LARKFVISPTKLRTYYTCAAMYRLEYVERLGRFYHRARAGYAFGHSLHRALDAFHLAGGAESVTAEDLARSLDAVWVEKGYGTEAEAATFRTEGLRILEEYHAVQRAAAADAARGEAPPLPSLLFTEKTLRIDLSADVALSGRIDRVDQHHDGSLEIVDYKSGRESVSESDVKDSLALGIYQLLLKQKYPDRRVLATLVALRSGASASYEMSDAERQALLEECLETGETLRTRDWESVLPVVNDHCPHCDFLPHCTRFWESQMRLDARSPP
jgi:RecB family exonuclease